MILNQTYTHRQVVCLSILLLTLVGTATNSAHAEVTATGRISLRWTATKGARSWLHRGFGLLPEARETGLTDSNGRGLGELGVDWISRGRYSAHLHLSGHVDSQTREAGVVTGYLRVQWPFQETHRLSLRIGQFFPPHVLREYWVRCGLPLTP